MYHKNQHHHKSKDLPSLFADYITPNGTGVSDVCLEAGALYIKQLNQVFYHFFSSTKQTVFISTSTFSNLSLFRPMDKRLKCLTLQPRSHAFQMISMLISPRISQRFLHPGNWATWSFTIPAPLTPALRFVQPWLYHQLPFRVFEIISPMLPQIRLPHLNSPQVASPTMKGKHCLLTSFVKGAGMMQGLCTQHVHLLCRSHSRF